MAQLLVIKTANTAFKQVGDIVGVYRDDHKFSDYEKEAFTIIKVAGYTSQELLDKMPYPKQKNVIRLPVGNTWVDDNQLEEKEVWQDPTDMKWRFLEPGASKFRLNIDTLTPADLASLASTSTEESKDDILLKLRQRTGDAAENTVECDDLNKVG